MSLYSALLLVSVTLHVSDPFPTPQNPEGYGLSTCSGVFISPNEILTANHCIAESRGHQWIKTSDGLSYSVSIEKHNKALDLALLRVAKIAPHIYARIGHSVNITQMVYTVNSGDSYEATYNEGKVSNLIIDEDTNTPQVMHTASILPGASGSGLFDNRGYLVGINTAMIRSFAIAVDLQAVNIFLKCK